MLALIDEPELLDAGQQPPFALVGDGGPQVREPAPEDLDHLGVEESNGRAQSPSNGRMVGRDGIEPTAFAPFLPYAPRTMGGDPMREESAGHDRTCPPAAPPIVWFKLGSNTLAVRPCTS